MTFSKCYIEKATDLITSGIHSRTCASSGTCIVIPTATAKFLAQIVTSISIQLSHYYERWLVQVDFSEGK
jgi:hypothetical protein